MRKNGSLKYIILLTILTVSYSSFAAIDEDDKVMVSSQKAHTSKQVFSIPVNLKVQPAINAQLVSEIEGHITKVYKKIGDKVKSGEKILAIKHPSGNYRTHILRSPINGIMAEISVIKGQFVTGSKSLAQVVSINNLTLIANVSAEDALSIKANYQVDVKVNSQQHKARIHAISPIINAATGTARLEVKLNKAVSLRIGQILRANILLPSINAIMVPNHSVVKRNRKNYIRLISKDNSVVFKEVQLGRKWKDKQLIINGLSDKQEFVVKSSDFLKTGDIIKRKKVKKLKK